MPNNLNDLDRSLLNRLTGLVSLLFIFTFVSVFYLNESWFFLQSTLIVMTIILLGLVVAVKANYVKTKSSFFLPFILIIMVFLLSIKFGLLFLLLFLVSIILFRLNKYIQSATMLIVAGLFVFLSSLLVGYNYLKHNNWNSVFDSITQYQSLSSTDFSILLAIVFCFLASGLLGYWLIRNEWLSNYHFKYDMLKFYAKISFGVLIAWIFLHFIGFYNLFINSNIWIIVLIIDALTVQFLLAYLVLFVAIWNENYRFGILLNNFIERVGGRWKIISVLTLFLFVVLKYLKYIS